MQKCHLTVKLNYAVIYNHDKMRALDAGLAVQ